MQDIPPAYISASEQIVQNEPFENACRAIVAELGDRLGWALGKGIATLSEAYGDLYRVDFSVVIDGSKLTSRATCWRDLKTGEIIVAYNYERGLGSL